MEAVDILKIATRGEDGHHQFRASYANADLLAADMVAFSNSEGGKILIGVNGDGTLSTLSREDTGPLHQLVSSVASQCVRPPIELRTEMVSVLGGVVFVIHVTEGMRKPYIDNEGTIWVKNGSDKQEVSSGEEIQRMCHTLERVPEGEEELSNGLTIADLDKDYFNVFFVRHFGKSLETQGMPLPTLLRNMKLMIGDVLNVSGALMFAQNPTVKMPEFLVKADAYSGCEIDAKRCVDSRDLSGKIADIFYKSAAFVLGKLGNRGNELTPSARSGQLGVPQVVLEELISNALIHRDYCVPAPIRISMFRDRINIVSPGFLPHNLTIENIRCGNTYHRNPILASFARKMFPYRGFENGLTRALRDYPHIEFDDDHESNRFTATVRLPILESG